MNIPAHSRGPLSPTHCRSRGDTRSHSVLLGWARRSAPRTAPLSPRPLPARIKRARGEGARLCSGPARAKQSLGGRSGPSLRVARQRCPEFSPTSHRSPFETLSHPRLAKSPVRIAPHTFVPACGRSCQPRCTNPSAVCSRAGANLCATNSNFRQNPTWAAYQDCLSAHSATADVVLERAACSGSAKLRYQSAGPRAIAYFRGRPAGHAVCDEWRCHPSQRYSSRMACVNSSESALFSTWKKLSELC